MLVRWKPFISNNGFAPGLASELERSFGEIDRMFRDFARPAMDFSQTVHVPRADVSETRDAILVKMDLPGHDPKSIDVNVENDVLTVRSERKLENKEQGETFHRAEIHYGAFSRSFTLPSTVDAQKTEARYDNGVLVITLPKREEAKPRSIQVKVQ